MIACDSYKISILYLSQYLLLICPSVEDVAGSVRLATYVQLVRLPVLGSNHGHSTETAAARPGSGVWAGHIGFCLECTYQTRSR